MKKISFRCSTALLAGLLVAGSAALSSGCKDKSAPAPEAAEEQQAETPPEEKDEAEEEDESELVELSLTSSAFKDGEAIPSKYTCDGDNISVPLQWSDLPDGTQSVAVAMHDPDAPNGTVYHWGIWAIPSGVTQLEEGLAAEEQLQLSDPSEADQEVGVFQALNISEEPGYAGPCPPEGDEPHRYIFEVFALDEPGASFSEPPTVQALLEELRLDALATGQLIGTYQRQE